MIKTFILNAEDNPATRMTIKELLEGTGEPYQVEEVSNGIEFDLRVGQYDAPIDIAILDIHIPSFDIISAVKKLWDDWKQTYIIVTSADDDLSVILELQNKYHIWGYVLKGSTTKDFGEELKQLVYDAHSKVQNKNEYINKQLDLLRNGATKY